MNQPPRDWDKEMADIDKAIARSGTPPAEPRDAGGLLPPGRPAPAAAPSARPGVRPQSVAVTWFWTGLAVTLAVALAIWPYDRACGLRLGFFLGATGITLLAAFLGALASWANRRGIAHLVSLLVLVWASVIAAREVLPRTGYARESRTWLCPDALPQPAPAQPAPAQPGTP
jgi:hypothetical protein